MTVRRTTLALIALVTGLAGLAAVPALSQSSTSALRGHDRNAPVNVEADRIEVQDRADRAIFLGNVRAQQGNMTLSAGRLTVAYSGQGGESVQIRRIDASGGVMLVSPSETARGQLAIYDLDQRLITMLGGVVLEQGANIVRGGRLVINLDTGRAVMDGSAVGGISGGGGRVSGTFSVPQRNTKP